MYQSTRNNQPLRIALLRARLEKAWDSHDEKAIARLSRLIDQMQLARWVSRPGR